MPWKWRYIARVSPPPDEPAFEFGIRANSFDEAETLAREWANNEGFGQAPIEVRPATPDDGPVGQELRRRFGRLTRPTTVHVPGEVRSLRLDEYQGVPFHREPRATPAQLASVEQRLGVGLPDPYRALLLWSNGGQTTTGVVLLATDQIYLLDDLDPATDKYRWLLVVGVDEGGDVVGLAPTGEVLRGRHDPPGVDFEAPDFGAWLRASGNTDRT